MHKGITLSGGGALLPGLAELLQNILKIRFMWWMIHLQLLLEGQALF